MPIWRKTLYFRRSDYDTYSVQLDVRTAGKHASFTVPPPSDFQAWLDNGFTISSWTVSIESEHTYSGSSTVTLDGLGTSPQQNIASTSGGGKRVTSYTGNSSNFAIVRMTNGNASFRVKVGMTGSASNSTVWLSFPQVKVVLTKTTTVTANNKIYDTDAMITVNGTTYKARSDVAKNNPIKYGSQNTTITASYWNSVTIDI